MQQRERSFKKSRLSVIVTTMLCLILLLSCSSIRITMTPRSIIEEKLLVQGMEKALSSINIEPIIGKKVTLNIVGLSENDMPFAEEYVRIWLLKKGVRVIKHQDECDLSLRVLLDVLAVDMSESLLGTPEFTFLGIPIPAIALYRNVRTRGRAEIQMYTFDRSGEALVNEFPTGIGVAKFDRYIIMFVISWTSTNLKFDSGDQKIGVGLKQNFPGKP